MLPEQTRLCFVAYRGNMNCGGQGVYLWFLSRELARLGFEIDVFVGPPYPDPMPFARRVYRLPNQEFWAKWFTRSSAEYRVVVLPLPVGPVTSTIPAGCSIITSKRFLISGGMPSFSRLTRLAE